jgi:hypothetical protein
MADWRIEVAGHGSCWEKEVYGLSLGGGLVESWTSLKPCSKVEASTHSCCFELVRCKSSCPHRPSLEMRLSFS